MTLKPEDFSQITLNLKKFTAYQMLDMNTICDIGIETASNFMADQLVATFRARILSDDLPPEEFTARHHIRYEVPASTWQMFKKRHAQRWYARRLVARRPVRYEPDPDMRGTHAVCTFNLERWRSYPQAKVQLPRDRFGDAMRFHSIDGPLWTQEQP